MIRHMYTVLPIIHMLGSANQKIESHKFFFLLLQYVGFAEVFLKPP